MSWLCNSCGQPIGLDVHVCDDVGFTQRIARLTAELATSRKECEQWLVLQVSDAKEIEGLEKDVERLTAERDEARQSLADRETWDKLRATTTNAGAGTPEGMQFRIDALVDQVQVLAYERDAALAKVKEHETLIAEYAKQSDEADEVNRGYGKLIKAAEERAEKAEKNLAKIVRLTAMEAPAFAEATMRADAAEAEVARLRAVLCDISAERQNLHDRIDDSQVAHWMCDAADKAIRNQQPENRDA